MHCMTNTTSPLSCILRSASRAPYGPAHSFVCHCHKAHRNLVNALGWPTRCCLSSIDISCQCSKCCRRTSSVKWLILEVATVVVVVLAVGFGVKEMMHNSTDGHHQMMQYKNAQVCGP